jgi:hypothetical protein
VPCYTTTADNDRALRAGTLTPALSAMVLGREVSRDTDDVATLWLSARALVSYPGVVVFQDIRMGCLKTSA